MANIDKSGIHEELEVSATWDTNFDENSANYKQKAKQMLMFL
jgi:hypothetical protein